MTKNTRTQKQGQRVPAPSLDTGLEQGIRYEAVPAADDLPAQGVDGALGAQGTQGTPDTPATSSTPEELRRLEARQRQLDALKPTQFPKGVSGNPNGRPKDPVKEIGKRIARAKVSKALKPRQRKLAQDMGFDPEDITLLENLMLELATSKNPMKIELYLQRTFGKVPNININAEVNAALVTKFRRKFTDSELEDIADGANPMDILFDKLPDIEDEDGSSALDDADDAGVIDASYSES